MAGLNSRRKLIQKVRVKNAWGLHARPAAKIVQLLQGSSCQVFFKRKQQMINARSLMSILLLAAPQHTQITIITLGDDADVVMQKLIDAFADCFGECNSTR